MSTGCVGGSALPTGELQDFIRAIRCGRKSCRGLWHALGRRKEQLGRGNAFGRIVLIYILKR
jgi:hypothetical protein